MDWFIITEVIKTNPFKFINLFWILSSIHLLHDILYKILNKKSIVFVSFI